MTILVSILRRLRGIKILFRNNSLLFSINYIGLYPKRKILFFIHKYFIFKSDDLQGRFTYIYKKNAWGSKVSRSGTGSTLEMTTEIRFLLPSLFREFSIKTLLDAPCGDFNWMKAVDLSNVGYIGVDIVQPLVDALNQNFSSPDISFVHLDITKDKLPNCDLYLNRDCLFHLSYLDTSRVLSNFLESGCLYFLTTSHENNIGFHNSDIISGGFRLIDLFSPPFSFPKEVLFQISEQGVDGLLPRSLYMWDRRSVRIGYSNLSSFIAN